MIYDEDDLTLFDLLHINGLLHLKGNRHEKFFKNLIEARHSTEGLDAIKKHVNSDLDIPPEFEHWIKSSTFNPKMSRINWSRNLSTVPLPFVCYFIDNTSHSDMIHSNFIYAI